MPGSGIRVLSMTAAFATLWVTGASAQTLQSGLAASSSRFTIDGGLRAEKPATRRALVIPA